jgi:drug/metabolite transporter (DMT)-like permease
MINIALLLVLGISWGLSFTVIKKLTTFPVPELVSVTLSTIIAATLLLIAYGPKSKFRNIFRKDCLAFAGVCGLSSFLLPLILEFHVLETVNASLASVIVSSAPIFAVLLFSFKSRALPNKLTFAAIALGLLACVLAIRSQGTFSGAGLTPTTILLLIMIPASYGFYHFYVETKWPDSLDAKELALAELMCCSLVCLALLPFQAINLNPINSDWALLCLLLGAMVSLEAVLYFTIQDKKGAVFCSFADYIATIAGVLSGAYILGETASLLIWPALALVLASTWISNTAKPIH